MDSAGFLRAGDIVSLCVESTVTGFLSTNDLIPDECVIQSRVGDRKRPPWKFRSK